MGKTWISPTANSSYNMMDLLSSPFPSNIVSPIRACLRGACTVDVASALFCALPPKKEAVPRSANFSWWSFILLCLSHTNFKIASDFSFQTKRVLPLSLWSGFQVEGECLPLPGNLAPARWSLKHLPPLPGPVKCATIFARCPAQRDRSSTCKKARYPHDHSWHISR